MGKTGQHCDNFWDKTQTWEWVEGVGDLLQTLSGLVATVTEQDRKELAVGPKEPPAVWRWWWAGELFYFPPPLSLEVNWRNKAGIYWEGADLLGTSGQGSTNLLLLLWADLILGCIAPLLPFFLSRSTKQAVGPWHPVLDHLISSLPPMICQCKQLPTFT